MNKFSSGCTLTPKAIKALTCPPDKKQVYFPVVRDLYLYVSSARAGTKSLVYRRKLNGTYREKHLAKLADSLDDTMAREIIKEARAKASELNTKIERGENPFDEATAAKKESTLQELFDAYIERHIKKSRKGEQSIKKDFERWFVKLAKRKVSSISRHDVEKFHGEINKERGPYAANRAIQLARAVYNKAKLWKLFLGDNPFSSISLLEEHSRDRFLSAEEAGRLIKALKNIPDNSGDLRTLRDFILLSMFTGVRKGNLLSMRWDELKEGTWTIPDEKMKNKRSQVIPLGGNELAILESRRKYLIAESIISPFVFPSKTSKSGHLTDIKHSWTTLREHKDVKLEDITIHDLRRSLAAAMASQNVNLALIKGALNHQDMKTTLNVYARTNKQAELEARQIAHSVWFKAAKQLQKEDNKVSQLKKTASK